MLRVLQIEASHDLLGLGHSAIVISFFVFLLKESVLNTAKCMLACNCVIKDVIASFG